jgi:hypothetical protein
LSIRDTFGGEVQEFLRISGKIIDEKDFFASSVTRMVQSGKDLYKAQALLGHKTPMTSKGA